jgi:TonB family protein
MYRTSRKRRLISSVFSSVMLVATSVPVIAQNPPETPKPKIQVIPRGAEPTFEKEVNGLIINGQDGPVTYFAGQQAGVAQDIIVSPGGNAYNFSFATSEMSFDFKVVKGAPYSADAVTETTQTLSDGNRIVRKTTSSLYRDSEGRTRREQSIGAIGPWTSADHPTQRIFITDPVSTTNWVLDPRAQTAHQAMLPPPPPPPPPAPAGIYPGKPLSDAPDVNKLNDENSAAINIKKKLKLSAALQGSAITKVNPEYPSVAKAAGVQGAVQVTVVIDENGNVISSQPLNGHPLLREAAIKAANEWKFKPTQDGGQPTKVEGTLTFNFTLNKPVPPEPAMHTEPAIAFATPTWNPSLFGGKTEFKQEDLGKQMMEGVEVQGTRIINSIPAGAIGNERQIDIVSERWYSNELQVVVMSRNSDPRIGETTYRMTNIVRSEPPADLFKVPADYTIVKVTEKPHVMRFEPAPKQ